MVGLTLPVSTKLYQLVVCLNGPVSADKRWLEVGGVEGIFVLKSDPYTGGLTPDIKGWKERRFTSVY